MNLSRHQFKELDPSDHFFDTLKSDYAEFPAWFAKKAEDYAYVFRGESGNIEGFLYLKNEEGPLLDVSPPLPPAKRIKVGTLKINPHGTRLGERFLKKIFDHAITAAAAEVYVTVFEKHAALIKLFERYGFIRKSSKTTPNGTELVFVKTMYEDRPTLLERYPMVKLADNAIYLLSLYPQWHTRLLPDSILTNEDASVVTDVSHTNSIHKVYLAAMQGMENLRSGDVLLIYRTSDSAGAAHYRSVATSLCVVEEYKNIGAFSNKEEFIRYCQPYSVFEPRELERFWASKKYPHIIRFTYNFALPKRITRGRMIEEMGFNGEEYWGFMRLTKEQLRTVLAAANLNENLVVN